MLGPSAAARRLQMSHGAVYSWVRNKRLLAWRKTESGLNIPAAQILGPRQVVPGLADIGDIVGSAELAWAFLTREWPFEDAAALPLELLKAGRTDEVLCAASKLRADSS